MVNMRALTKPPATGASVAALLILSTTVFFLRWSTHHALVTAANGPQEQPDTDERPVKTPAVVLFRDIAVPYITLVTPGLSVVYPWVLVTTAFVETSIVELVVTGATLELCGRYCERVWGSKELAKFLGIQAVVPTAVTAFLLIVKYILTIPSEGVASQFHIVNGGIAFQIGFLVALKQLVPEHSIVLFRGAFTVKVKHLVMPALILYTLFGAFVFQQAEIVLLAWTGFFSSWIYLRFFRIVYVDPILPTGTDIPGASTDPAVNPNKTPIKGDASEVFAFSTFFYPAPLRDVIHQASRVVFHTLVALKVCTPFNQDEVEQGNLRASLRASGRSASNNGGANGGLKTAAEVDAERRRAIALKVLEERLDNTRRAAA